MMPEGASKERTLFPGAPPDGRAGPPAWGATPLPVPDSVALSPKLLAVDLDGTLLDLHGRPHKRDVRAVRAALAEGVQVSIVTGRLYSGTRAVAQTLGLRGPVGCADGSHLVNARDHATLLHIGVGGADGTKLRKALGGADLATFVFAKDAIGHDARGSQFVDYVTTWSRDVRVARDVLDHELWGAADGITAVVGLGTQDQVAEAVDAIVKALAGAVMVAMFPVRRGTHASAGTWALIVRAAGGTKGTAVRWIAEREGVRLEDTVCVGDWLNDLPMFEVAGRSFAMGQAPDEVKSRATHVLDETVNDGGGVARTISEAFGITVD
jgi:hydroxymethylpyrimidine pyrophosphatase-like HAD family hydrolase